MSDNSTLDGSERLQHALRTPLTVMVLRVQLVARRIEACQTIADEERHTIRRHLEAFDQASRWLVQTLDEHRGGPSPSPSNLNRRSVQNAGDSSGRETCVRRARAQSAEVG